MSITNFTELQTAFDNWENDTIAQARYPEFIALFEAWANSRIRTNLQITSTNLTMSDGNGTLPSDYLEYRRVTRLTAIPQDMTYVTPAYLQIIYPDTIQQIFPVQQRIPSAFFTIENLTLKVRPKDDSSQVQVLYYAKIPALTAAAPTNWLLTNYPNAYLFGSLMEAELYRRNYERAAMWKGRRDEILADIYDADSVDDQGTGAMMVVGPTP